MGQFQADSPKAASVIVSKVSQPFRSQDLLCDRPLEAFPRGHYCGGVQLLEPGCCCTWRTWAKLELGAQPSDQVMASHTLVHLFAPPFTGLVLLLKRRGHGQCAVNDQEREFSG